MDELMGVVMALKQSVESLNIDITASRTSGVAPLSVNFDATGTTGLADTAFWESDCNDNNAAYMDATFYWNFDSTNVDSTIDHRYSSGFITTCVFKEPGTYTVQLKVYDNTGYIGYKNQIITVSAFSGTTYYFSNAGNDDTGDGSIETPYATPAKAMTLLGPNVRCLFNCGDTFTYTSLPSASSKTGPWIIGAYGVGDPPLFYSNYSDSSYSSMYFYGCTDGRIMDINVRSVAENSTSPRYPAGISWNTACVNMLKYRTEEYYTGGLSLSPGGQYNTIAECEFYYCTNTGYTSSDSNQDGTIDAINHHGSLIGNYVHDKNLVDTENEEHIFRLQSGYDYVINFNRFGPNIKINYDALTIRGGTVPAGTTWNGTSTLTQRIVIYKNILHGYVQAVWPQNRNSSTEYQHHIVWDSNLIRGQGDFANDRAIALGLHSTDILVRNNIIYDYTTGFNPQNDTVVGPSSRLRFYNNTIIAVTNSESFYAFLVDYECRDVFIRNNRLLDISTGSTPSFISIADGDYTTWGGTSDYNRLWGAGWSSPTPFDGSALATWQSNSGQDSNSTVASFTLQSTDPASPDFGKLTSADSGEDLKYNHLDFYQNERNGNDIGACEYVG